MEDIFTNYSLLQGKIFVRKLYVVTLVIVKQSFCYNYLMDCEVIKNKLNKMYYRDLNKYL